MSRKNAAPKPQNKKNPAGTDKPELGAAKSLFRAYPNDRVVMRPSEKCEAKA